MGSTIFNLGFVGAGWGLGNLVGLPKPVLTELQLPWADMDVALLYCLPLFGTLLLSDAFEDKWGPLVMRHPSQPLTRAVPRSCGRVWVTQGRQSSLAARSNHPLPTLSRPSPRLRAPR